MSFTPQMLATLEAQRDAFASDAHLRERAAAWGDATPAECVAAVDALCADAAFFLARLDDAALERALTPAPLPPETLDLLARLWRSRVR
jgi:hypothetical protein